MSAAAPPPPPRPEPAASANTPVTPEAVAVVTDGLTNHPALVLVLELLREGKDVPNSAIFALSKAERRYLKNSAAKELKLRFLEQEDQAKAAVDDQVLTVLKETKTLADGNAAPWVGKPLQVSEFRTPGSDDARTSLNTDRDVRVLFKSENGWTEIPREYWQDQFYAGFAKLIGYSEERLVKLAASEELDTWRKLEPGRERDQLGKRIWAGVHGWLATDKSHPEAIEDFSDQARDEKTLQPIQLPQTNSETFGRPGARSIDPAKLAEVVKAKAKTELQRGNPLEAAAQLDKAAALFRLLVASARKDGVDVSIDAVLEKAMAAIHALSPFDVTAEVRLKAVEQTLSTYADIGNLYGLTDRLADQLARLGLP